MTKKFYDEDDRIDDNGISFQDLLKISDSRAKMFLTQSNRLEKLIEFFEKKSKTYFTGEDVLNTIFDIEREYPLKP